MENRHCCAILPDGATRSICPSKETVLPSELGYGMLFGSDVKKQFFQKRIKGRGYCDVGTSVISEFYTPLVPKGHDFLQTIGSLAQARQDGTATCEAKGDGTD